MNLDPRRTLWGPVLLTVVLLAVGGLLPHGEASSPAARSGASASWLAPPSWPAFALREAVLLHPASAVASWGPSWPAFALRPNPQPVARVASPRAIAHPAAAPLRWVRGTIVVAGAFAFAVLLAFAALAVFVVPRLRGARRRRGGVDLALRVLTLAERGVEQRHIARHAGLPRDAVRAMLHHSAQTPRA